MVKSIEDLRNTIDRLVGSDDLFVLSEETDENYESSQADEITISRNYQIFSTVMSIMKLRLK